MGKLRPALCGLCLALLLPLAVLAGRHLPTDTRPLVEEKYAGWSGVLRLWVFEGWAEDMDALPAWLNRCIARFEKRSPGVYVQPRYVDAGAITAMNDSGIPKPDMLLIPPGLLSSPEGLAPLTPPDNLRGPLAGCGAWGDAVYAVPVAMGGYLWAWNAALTEGIPDTWHAGGATLAAPGPQPWRRWDAALLALCSGRYSEEAPNAPAQTPAPPLPGVDLGLAGSETPAPTPPPAAPEGELSCRLPDGFRFEDDAWRRFANGEVAAMPVTQREVRRLQALSAQGKGPDWRLCAGAAAFTDQLLCLAVVNAPGAEEQRALCAAFLTCLLEDTCQGDLYRAACFSVTDAGSGYDAGDPLLTLDAALRDPGLCAPNCFDAHWQDDCAGIVREFTDNTAEAWRLWRSFAGRLRKNPNI